MFGLAGTITAIDSVTKVAQTWGAVTYSDSQVVVLTEQGALALAVQLAYSSDSNALALPRNATPGQGQVDIQITTSGLASNLGLTRFIYSAPNITSISPAVGLSATQITVFGANFGLSGYVSFGASSASRSDQLNCLLARSANADGTQLALSGTWSHTRVFFMAPNGVGTSHTVTVTVAGLTSPPFKWSYSPPIINAAVPSVSTQGGSTITIQGTAFGFTSAPTVTVGGLNCPLVGNPSYSNIQIT